MIKIQRLLFFASATIFFGISANAQSINVKVWPNDIPGAIQEQDYWEKPSEEEPCISKISSPEMEVFLPDETKANGTAVLIFPGGGYSGVCLHHEGYDVAKWLTKKGVAGIVMKYRLPSHEIMENKNIGPLQDAQEGMRIIRRNAEKWNIDPEKVGVMGFSAGGHLASSISTHYDDPVYPVEDDINARPDFSLLIYPVISMDTTITHMGSRRNLIGPNPDAELVKHFSNELQVDKNTPPTFLVHSADDEVVPVMNSIRYFEALKKHEVPAELHIYERGGHGYGMGINGGTESAWPKAALSWMKVHGWL